MDEDHIVGRYIYINSPVREGRGRVFYEKPGNGPQEIVFLHTAGSDSRQYHGIMKDKRMMEKYTMIAFDLLAHGRSFPSKSYVLGNHTNTADSYVGAIREVVETLKPSKPISCSSSMVGQVYVSVAICVEEVGAGGTITLQGCGSLTTDCQFNNKSPVVNQSLYNPDWTYGLMTPGSPAVNKILIWHLHSPVGLRHLPWGPGLLLRRLRCPQSR